MHTRSLLLAPPLLAALFISGCRLDRRGSSDGVAIEEAPITSIADGDRGVEIRALLIQPTYQDGEWVELRNPGQRDVDIGGWRLDSGGGDPGYVIPPGTIIRAGGRLDLGRSMQAHRTGGIQVKLLVDGIELGDGQDWLALRDAAGRTVDSVAWRESSPDMPLTHRRSELP